jgi:hypothetical protein
MELENLLIPVDDYCKKEIERLNEKTDTRVKIIKIELDEYIKLIDLIGLIEDANYKIQELEEKIEELETPDEEEDFSYSGGDVRDLF